MKHKKTSLRLIAWFLCTLVLAAYGFTTVRGSAKSDSRPTTPPPPGVNSAPRSAAERLANGVAPGHGAGGFSNRRQTTKDTTKESAPARSGAIRQSRTQQGP